MVKKMEFQGVAAHAGGSPHLGVNALYAANLAMNAVNALRETFEDDKHIRFHPIITSGGDSVNAIPDKVTMESYVRGADMDAIVEANQKVNRAVAASAAAMGANVRLEDVPGYHPIRNCVDLIPIMQQAMESVLETVVLEPNVIRSGCSDVGDLSSVMPMIHPYVSGASGKSHGNDYRITDPDTACVDSAKVQLCFLKLLLENGGERAKQVLRNFQPLYPSIGAYFQFMDSLNVDIQAVSYEEDGKVMLTTK
jgi:metal-dependent amidase/aminoacylase/carboxypeptidase family protein